MSAIDRVIKIAKNEIGYLEKRNNAQLDSKTANAGSANYTKYWRDVLPTYQGQPWCACFVTWCFVQAFGISNTKQLLKHYPYVYVPTIMSLFTNYANPQRGDIVGFYHNNDFVHTGIVTFVNGDYFETIEGNTSGASSIISNGGGVCKKHYYNSKLPGTKFIRPNYSIIKGDDSMISEEEFKKLQQTVTSLQNTVQKLQDENSILKQAIGWNSDDPKQPALFMYNDDNLQKYISDDANEVIGNLISSGKLSVDLKTNAFEPLSRTALRLLIIQNRDKI